MANTMKSSVVNGKDIAGSLYDQIQIQTDYFDLNADHAYVNMKLLSSGWNVSLLVNPKNSHEHNELVLFESKDGAVIGTFNKNTRTGFLIIKQQ